MGQKDFSDWNGRKRKEILFPTPEKPVHHMRGGGKKKIVGIKTMVDRYKAEVERVRYWLDSRRRSQNRKGYGLHPWWHNRVLRDQIKQLRKLQDKYRKEGVLERVLEAL